MAHSIQCPQCGTDITEALIAQARNQVQADLATTHKKELEEAVRIATQKASEVTSRELKEKEEQLANYKTRAQKAEEAELSIRKEKRELEEAKERFAVEKEREMDRERQKIREAAQKEVEEKDKYVLAEKDKLINDLKNAVEDMKRKASQGSQQTQGEVFELELEQLLPKNFPNDVITPVAKGTRGGDIRQVVKSPSGKVDCGVILWESKRTKAWSDGWIGKLKEDMRREGADVGIIISTVLPADFTAGIGKKDGIWICSEQLLLPLAQLVREKLIQVAYQKATQAQQGDKANLIYQYITSTQFAQQVEAIAQSYREMKEGIDRERAAYERLWKAREGQLNRIMMGTANIYGQIQGLAGANALPQISGLELADPDTI
jgi:hypothetical protein